MTPPGFNQTLADVHDHMEMVYPAYTREEGGAVGQYFTNVIDNAEGFVIPFDHAWQMAGYSSKGKAKRILTGDRGKLGLKEGLDYTITRPCKDACPGGKAMSRGRNAVQHDTITRAVNHFPSAGQASSEGVGRRSGRSGGFYYSPEDTTDERDYNTC